MYYNIDSLLEGNMTLDQHKMRFGNLLNSKIKTSWKDDLLYDSVLDNFTLLLKLMNKADGKVPKGQMCRGELGDWSKCSKDCGRGKQTRQFNVTHKVSFSII